MRRSELLNLKGEHIDLEANVIRVEEAKGKKRREIPMTGRVREIVQELGPVLFSDLTADQVTHKFTDIATHLRLEGAKLHSLRHTFGTWLAEKNVPIHIIKTLAGHSSVRVTEGYITASPTAMRGEVAKLQIHSGEEKKKQLAAEKGS